MKADRATWKALVLDCVASVAPDVDVAALDPGTSLRQQADLDSFDFLQLCIQISARAGVDVPESDYGKLATLESWVEYLAERSSAKR